MARRAEIMVLSILELVKELVKELKILMHISQLLFIKYIWMGKLPEL